MSVCSQKRIIVRSDVKLTVRALTGKPHRSREPPRHSSGLAPVRVAEDQSPPAGRLLCDGDSGGDCDGCESHFWKLPGMLWVGYAACRHLYRWCSPPNRAIDITSPFTPGRGSTFRWFGVSLSSES